MAAKSKTLEYRRVRWLDVPQDLEALVRQAWGQFGTQAERTVSFRDQTTTTGLRARDGFGRGYAIHCARYTDGQAVATVPRAPASQVVVGRRDPGPHENFMDADFMAVLRGDHVVCLGCGRNAGRLRNYLVRLFQLAGMPEGALKFEIVRIARPDKVRLIGERGVKGIDLRAGIAEATMTALAGRAAGGGIWQTIKQEMGGALRAITQRDETLEQVRLAEHGTVKLVLDLPKKELTTAKDGFDHLAEEIVEDEDADGYIIRLRGGDTIKPEEISVRREVKIEAYANSVSADAAWDEMLAYMDDLAETGQLEA